MNQYSVEMIETPEKKEQIARTVLEALTEWFEVPETREEYIRKSREQICFAAFAKDQPVGFLCLKETGRETVELAVMGVLKEHHRHGVGKALFQAAKSQAEKMGYALMQVKTVAMGCYPDYDETNRFYKAVGFMELEVIPVVWGDENPCQIYVMPLNDSAPLLRLILSRHSYRGRYKPNKVPREHLTAIMRAGLAAPSGCNKQTTSLIAVDDPDMLAKLKAVIDPPVAQTAPAMICILTRHVVAYRDRCFATQDYAAAIENMLLAITALGYQSCWYEGHITDADRIGDKMAKLLDVPEEYELVCVLPVGIAEDDVTQPRKRAFEERAWFNRFPSDDSRIHG